MSRWHLVDERGAIRRSCEADSLPHARFRLAPVLPGQSVVSAASFAYPLRPIGTARPRAVRLHQDRSKPSSTARHARWQARKRGEAVPFVRDCRYNERIKREVLRGNERGESDAALARRFGCSVENVRHHRTGLGLPTADERMRMVVRAYWSLGWSDGAMARRLDWYQPNISRIRRKLGLPSNAKERIA